MHIAFCGGGSGGHITPAIAIAESVCHRLANCRLQFITSGRKVDQDILSTWKAPQNFTAHPLPLHSSSRKFRYASKTLSSTLRCVSWFRAERPDVVLGTGGFASVPGVMAAKLCGIPITILEPNRIPGRATRMLSRFAEVTFLGMADEQTLNWPTRVYESGVPVRKQFFETTVSAERKELLILGGSLGATSVNRLAVKALQDQAHLMRDWTVIHQTGEHDAEHVKAEYERSQTPAHVTPFISDASKAIKTAGLIICRAGALTIAEISAAGRASILIPLQTSKDGHQLANALHYSSRGAAEVVNESSEQAVSELSAALERLVTDDESLAHMQNSAQAASKGHAADNIAAYLIEQRWKR